MVAPQVGHSPTVGPKTHRMRSSCWEEMGKGAACAIPKRAATVREISKRARPAPHRVSMGLLLNFNTPCWPVGRKDENHSHGIAESEYCVPR